MKSQQIIQKKSLPPVLILGFDNHGLALARSLGRRGIPVNAVDCEPSEFARYSKYVKKFSFVRSLEDYSLLDFLIENAKFISSQQVLYITKDKTVSLISENRECLPVEYLYNLPDHPTVNRLMNKENLVGYLDEVKCSFPRTAVITEKSEIPAILNHTGLPCLIKPALRAYGFKAAIAYTEKDLIQILSKASTHMKRLIVQEWIPGLDQNVHFCFLYLNACGEVKATFTGKKIRQYPKYWGIASAVEGCQNDFIRSESIRLMKNAGYKGFGSTEFKKDDRSGEYKFIEFTVGRTDYDVEVSFANRIDLPFIGYCDMVGLKDKKYNGIQNNRLQWVDFGRDISALRESLRDKDIGKIIFAKEVLKNLGPKTVLSFFDICDIRPCLEYMINRIKAAFRTIRRILHLKRSRYRG